MSSDNPRAEKVAVVDEVTTKLTGADAVIVTEYRGMSVGQLAALRRQLRSTGGEYKVYKNTLARFAAEAVGVAGLSDLLTGPSAITFINGDAAAVAKTLRDVARVNPLLVIKGGSMSGKAMSAGDVESLADLPSREVLLSMVAGALQAPLVKTAGLLQALPRNLAYGLKALIDQHGTPDQPDGAQPDSTQPDGSETVASETVASDSAADAAA